MNTYYKSVSVWLLIGCIMILMQIIIGGITRLTDSGLSITEWEIVKGTLPPLNETEWNITFEKYKKHAKKQFESIHSNMTLLEFKRIFFWEYFHRLWARSMGFVFIIPFLVFIFQKKIPPFLLKRLILVIFLASLSAIFGWLMVASGLNNDKRTWVNAYNLLVHLILASTLFSYLVFTYYKYSFNKKDSIYILNNYVLLKTVGGFIVLQIGLGALMAGMKAGLVFPYPFIVLKWTSFMELISMSNITNGINYYDYESNLGIKLWIQVFHRVNAWFIGIFSCYIIVKNKNIFSQSKGIKIYLFSLCLQILIGIITVTLCQGKIPVFWGVLHQAVAFLFLASYLWVLFSTKPNEQSRV